MSCSITKNSCVTLRLRGLTFSAPRTSSSSSAHKLFQMDGAAATAGLRGLCDEDQDSALCLAHPNGAGSWVVREIDGCARSSYHRGARLRLPSTPRSVARPRLSFFGGKDGTLRTALGS